MKCYGYTVAGRKALTHSADSAAVIVENGSTGRNAMSISWSCLISRTHSVEPNVREIS